MDAENAVLDELKSLRKLANGATLQNLATCPTICDLLGNGDPSLALSVLTQTALNHEWSQELEAAFFSLGMASSKVTHLDRLEEFAATWYMDQRQARRYSDKGLLRMARLIATNWATYSAPQLRIVANFIGLRSLDISLYATHPAITKMQAPSVEVLNDNQQIESLPEFEVTAQGRLIHFSTRSRLRIELANTSSLSVVWRGEIWPKFQSIVIGCSAAHIAQFETLGNKSVLTFMTVTSM